MMLLKVTANDGQQIGALIDLASDTNYITHAAASRLGLKSEKITLVVQGVGGMTVTANTKRYLLKVRFRTPEDVETVTYESKTHFARSMRTAAAKYEEIVKCIGCCKETRESGLRQESDSRVRSSMATNKEVLEWWKWESISAACEPKCGGCRCGACQPGGKRDDPGGGKGAGEDKEGLSYVASDHHIDAPHWDASYPWTEDPASLPINREAVMATFLRTEKRLLKQPEWRTACGEQVHEMSCAPAVSDWEHAALGDITKMYNSVWLKDRERHLHRFLWRDNPEEDIGSTPSQG
ncbi:hypothetical protein AAFF_G00145470 [Aldrovandia affinis]|uniref:Uncharacterized protein n=1 Tax=Aldrovandia affinis TaxID=143900 RepID=A0AAD7T0Q6_9TELE|nr:hypothetical protein AAFF_G00145470 [Aldrovandia affinis]